MEWLSQYGFTLLQTISIVASLLFTAFTLRSEVRERKIENLFNLANAHREIWKTIYEQPELGRIFEVDLPPDFLEPTLAERIFVRSLIFHLSASFRAQNFGMYFDEHGLAADVREFFSMPIPRTVWESLRPFQEPDFVQFIEAQL